MTPPGAAAVYECPYCGGATRRIYRCDECGKDLTDQSLDRMGAGQ